MFVYLVERTDKIGWCEDYAMVVVATDSLHAERKARLSSDDFRKAKLKLSVVDIFSEAVILKANKGA